MCRVIFRGISVLVLSERNIKMGKNKKNKQQMTDKKDTGKENG